MNPKHSKEEQPHENAAPETMSNKQESNFVSEKILRQIKNRQRKMKTVPKG